MDEATKPQAAKRKRPAAPKTRKNRPPTARELSVLQLVSKGFSSKECGARLGVSDRTIEQHLYTLRRKLECQTTIEAACRAIREGLI